MKVRYGFRQVGDEVFYRKGWVKRCVILLLLAFQPPATCSAGLIPLAADRFRLVARRICLVSGQTKGRRHARVFDYVRPPYRRDRGFTNSAVALDPCVLLHLYGLVHGRTASGRPAIPGYLRCVSQGQPCPIEGFQ